jgi:hypothetical protein
VTFDVTLERRIRELCAQAVAARETDEFQPILSELREALRQHAQRLKSLVAEYPFSAVDIDKVVPISNGTPKQVRDKKGKAV